MPTQSKLKPAKSNATPVGTRRRKPRTAPTRLRKPAAVPERKQDTANPQTNHRTTKQERVLMLLSRAGGASIEEIMRATNWQQHSVRGFFAGTVKKKLGFNLVSDKKEGGVRRYRIDTGNRN